MSSVKWTNSRNVVVPLAVKTQLLRFFEHTLYGGEGIRALLYRDGILVWHG